MPNLQAAIDEEPEDQSAAAVSSSSYTDIGFL
jgi:hypothetical protein